MGKEKQHHFLQIHSSLGKDALVLERLNVREGMSRLFEIRVGFTANQRISDMKKHIGEGVSVSLKLGSQGGGGERYFHGHFLSIWELGKPLHNSDGQRYEAIIVPRAWSAANRTNCRIFQDKTVKKIVETILGEHSVAFSWKVKKGLYNYRYCVQYNETDWDFVCRLLAHEGLSFFFQHANGSHTMVITDHEKAYPKAAEGSVVFCSRPTGSAHISSWYAGFKATANSIIEHGFDFETPKQKVKDTSNEKVPGGPFGSRELFGYFGEDRPIKDGASLAALHLKGIAQESESYRAVSDYRSFGVGLKFSFKEHEDEIPPHNEFVITEIAIEASVPLNADNQPSMGNFFYTNSFRCVPTKAPYVPRKLPKPMVPGLQTATVTCAPGEEIYVDEHGRIKVQFHWDREGKYDQKSSCWIRVAQSWAGENWGAQFIPREGQEVLVEFLSGDPDLPLITGSVYNGKNKMPYEPLSKKNISGFKTRSTTKGGGANYNEISFDDTIGKELLLVHAEKDHELTVEHDQTDDIKNDRTTEVGNDDTLTVLNNQTVDITGDQKVTVGKTITVEAGQSITLKTGAASLTMEASGAISIKGTSISVQGTTIDMKAAKISLN
ncbi:MULTISPECIES: type VI secretion system Vgr family protein [Marinobacter]|uniref:Type VI secretion system tip protein TssI/VgrG n=1 Tax=Marinobacter xestospongiae TaxID=994319 RepID=A0ABU3VY71_9GAMM|nr:MULTISPECIES: type VI secretion system tip protein TssI/VgrG [Marinobacter]MCG8518536.1 type VI secretion system tip protein VgrG [Pseudomonadales bacterium]MCK7567145.1 type VI secretion system tip protein VgrG [Marinobacter xestospongiae]MDV2078917.1 type VI secretion system tip protein TssI/VgrG [Marinobacter xestospongiae]UDL04781.1 type VI secretion system tip protein VgrG [Marinobacter sp. CA1]